MVTRIQQLESQFAARPAATATGSSAAGSTASTGATTGAAFAAQLTAATAAARTRATGSSTGPSGTGTGAPKARTGPTGGDVVAAAKKYLGVPYVFGSTKPSVGLDCSSLVQRAYKDLGIKLPRLSWDQAKAGTAVRGGLANARPGDILGFNGNGHVAIYLGHGKMIAAPQPGERVKIQRVYAKPSAIRRIIPTEPTSSAVVRPTRLRRSGPAGTVSGVPYADLFNAAGARYGVSPKLLAAVAKVESGYNPRAVSPAGARGLMQIMPATARGLGVNPMKPAEAVDGAARLLAKHLKKFDSLSLALAAYNAGAGAVQRYGGIPPYAETQAYVPKVRKAMAALD